MSRAACLLAARATPYQPQGFTGTGYVESWRGEDKAVITCEGNLSTRPAMAGDMAMLRAAEPAGSRRIHLPVCGVRHRGGGTGGGTLYKRGARIDVVMLRNPPASARREVDVSALTRASPR